MVDKNDWRLTNQEEYLYDAKVKRGEFKAAEQRLDHCHCAFCWDKFSEYEGDLRNGYRTNDGRYWICEECYNDFKEMFRFELEH